MTQHSSSSSTSIAIAEANAADGIQRAARSHEHDVREYQIRFLSHLLSQPDYAGTIDGIGDTLLTYSDRSRGKWKGEVSRGLVRAGVIEGIGACRSRRVSRNRGLVTLFKLVDPQQAQRHLMGLIALRDACRSKK